MARNFNGTTDLIAADAAAASLFPADASPLTLAIWLKGALGATKSFLSIGRSTTANAAIVLTTASGPTGAIRLVITDNTNTTRLNVSGTAVIQDSTWHHACLTLDTSRLVKFYADGILDVSTSYTSGGTYTMGRVGIGCQRRSTNIQFFPGALAEVAAWTRILSSREVASLASGLPANFLAPNNYWPLWGNDSPEPDLGISTHVTGVLTGTVKDISGPPIYPKLAVLL